MPIHDKSFPPIADAHVRLLILGSLPIQVSLQRQRYYAQPQNAFWKIMGRLFSTGPELAYAELAQHLVQNRIALWDGLRVCAPAGSLNAAIVHSSVVPNDLGALIATHPGISLI